jgi:hypothetical protein
LLVDDEPDNSSIFTIGLEDAKFEIDACNDTEGKRGRRKSTVLFQLEQLLLLLSKQYRLC